MKLDRRTLLIGGGVGVGLIVGYALWPGAMASDLAVERGEQAFGAFIKIARDGRITVAVPQVETGQGIWTGLPQVVADELGAAWGSIAVEPAPLTKAYADPVAEQEGWRHHIRITAGSTSIRAFAEPMRKAAATARAMLVGAAADRWNIGEAECEVEDGFVIGGPRKATFGELAEEAAGRRAPSNPPRRTTTKARLVGQPLPRLDGPAKAEGRWRFAADVRLPGMLYASARIAPPGGKLQGFSRDAIGGTPGIRHLTANDQWIAVVAEDWWAAERALKAASPRFSGERSSPDMRAAFDHAMANVEPAEWFSNGDYDAAVTGSRALAATYYVAPSQHLGLEPLTATARVGNGKADVFATSLAPGFGKQEGTLFPLPPGEPAGRALDNNLDAIAVALAKSVGRPVQLTLSQSVSQIHDRVAPGALAALAALPGAGGITTAWSMRVATSDGLAASLARLSDKDTPDKLDSMALDGAVPPYAIPNVRIESIAADLPFTAGYMRGSPQREFTFFTESFIDELARAAGLEPLGFRMSMLGNNGRLARCLQAATRLAGWDGGGPGSTMGLSGASAFGSHIGLVANATIGADQRVEVHRLVAAVDCGRVINSGLVAQQIEAGLIWALAQATVAAPEWVAGMPRARPMGGIDLPRMTGTPQIVVEIIPSSEASGGVSGLGTLPLAPAVANAIHSGSGKRMRALPLDPMAA